VTRWEKIGQNGEELLRCPIERNPEYQTSNINVQNGQHFESWPSNLLKVWIFGPGIQAARLPLLLLALT
jgi:hypothetical protein